MPGPDVLDIHVDFIINSACDMMMKRTSFESLKTQSSLAEQLRKYHIENQGVRIVILRMMDLLICQYHDQDKVPVSFPFPGLEDLCRMLMDGYMDYIEEAEISKIFKQCVSRLICNEVRKFLFE